MTKRAEITQKDFNKLLDWLDKDREIAAEKYKSIHQRLVRYFLSRKAFPADGLADETIDRAIQKVNFLIKEYKGEPSLFLYAIAKKVYLEHLRAPKAESIDVESSNKAALKKDSAEETSSYYECMSKCLKSLPRDQREFIIEYFQHERQKKITHHKKMAERLSLDANAMRTRIYRIRINLEECVKICLQKKSL